MQFALIDGDLYVVPARAIIRIHGGQLHPAHHFASVFRCPMWLEAPSQPCEQRQHTKEADGGEQVRHATSLAA